MMCTLLPRVAVAQGTPTNDTFTISDLTWDDDYEGYMFTVGFQGSRIYRAFNLDIFLPQGITVMSDVDEGFYVYINTDDGVYPYKGKGNNKTYYHTVSCNVLTGNQLRVTGSSNDGKDFLETGGALFNVYVTINESAFTSSFSPKPIVKLSGLNLTSLEEGVAVKYVPADFSCRPFSTGIPTERTLPVNISAANKVGTLILPFDADLPAGLRAYSCSTIDGENKLTLTPVASIEACKPYIVYAENGYSGNLSGTATLSDDTNVTDVFTDGYLTGVLTATTTNTGYVLQNQGSGPMFYDTDGATFSIPAGRCYLTPSASGEVKAFSFKFDIETAIQDEIVNCKSSNCKLLYDLSGRRVESPTRGIYIQGTRMVVVK